MARADYMLCEVCDGKAFYDATLNYEPSSEGTLYDLAGQPRHLSLGYCSQVAAICTDCFAKGWRLALTQTPNKT